MGILLLKMFYDRYFEFRKVIHWSDIEQQINESEVSNQLKSIFFEEQREFYSEAEWQAVRKRITNCLKEFEVLGWITRMPSIGQESISFTIKESIHRFAELYDKEITQFEEFVNTYKKQSRK